MPPPRRASEPSQYKHLPSHGGWHGACDSCFVSDLPANERPHIAADDRPIVIRNAVLRYLRRHPQASDSVTGICEWWLAVEGASALPSQVEAVLKTMVSEGLLQAIRLIDDTVIYAGSGSGSGSGQDRRE